MSRHATPPIRLGPYGSEWPVVGRDELVKAAAGAVARPGPRSLVLSGRPGVGRSRLAQEALRSAHDRDPAGYAAEWFVATRAAASIPFGAFARLLDGFDLGTSDRLALFRSAVEAVAVRAGSRRLVIAVDDAHLLDQAGAALLHQVAATGTAFVLATVRSGEPAPEPIVALGRPDLGARIELPPLTGPHIGRLLRAVLDGPVDGATLHLLVTSTGGNLSFLSELVAAGVQSEALQKADGIWRWTGPLGAHPRLLAVVEAHLGALTPDERVLLELLAAAEPLEVALLDRLVPGRVLESVERKDLLEVVEDNRRVAVRLAHPLHAEAIRATTPPLRVRALRRRLASALRDTGHRRSTDILRSAAWRLESGETVSPGELLTAAGQAASCSDRQRAERLSEAAAAGASGFDTEVELARLALTRALSLYFALGVTAEVDQALRAAEAMLCQVACRGAVDFDTEFGVLFALRGLTAGRPDQAARALEALLEGLDGDEPARLHAVAVAATAFAMTGRTEEALATAARGRDLASRWVDVSSPVSLSLLAAAAVAHGHAGNLAEAETLATAGYRRTVLDGNDAARTSWTLLLGRAVLDRGQVRTAARWFREGTALSRVVSPLGQLPRCLANLSIAAGQAGDGDAAEAALAEAEALSRAVNPLFDSELALARAWTAAACGQTSRAAKLALEAGDVASERGQVSVAAAAFHDAARLGAVDEAVARLPVVVATVDGRRAALLLAHAIAVQAHDGAALDAVSVQFEETGATLLAAEAATSAAAVHRRNGKLTSSLKASDRARALHGRCEGARTPALDGIQCDVLTRREREVALLAARGLSNRAIAEHLVVSVRTVENQLYRVYGKLGVAGRDELATALGGPSAGSVPGPELEWSATHDGPAWCS